MKKNFLDKQTIISLSEKEKSFISHYSLNDIALVFSKCANKNKDLITFKYISKILAQDYSVEKDEISAQRENQQSVTTEENQQPNLATPIKDMLESMGLNNSAAQDYRSQGRESKKESEKEQFKRNIQEKNQREEEEARQRRLEAARIIEHNRSLAQEKWNDQCFQVLQFANTEEDIKFQVWNISDFHKTLKMHGSSVIIDGDFVMRAVAQRQEYIRNNPRAHVVRPVMPKASLFPGVMLPRF